MKNSQIFIEKVLIITTIYLKYLQKYQILFVMITLRYLNNAEQTQKYEAFSDNLIKMQLKQKGKKGFILVGPSKNGKTIIMCSLTGVNMRTFYNPEKAITYVQVDQEDPQLKKLTYSDTINSITEIPNTRSFNNEIMIVDMPGHSDSHKLRQLCNFYYIREMVLKMKCFHFMLVLNVNGNRLRDVDIKMMQSFKLMFPNSQKYLSICINRYNSSQKQPIMKSISQQLQSEHQQLYKFYSLALKTPSKIVLIPKQNGKQAKIWRCPDQIRRLVINSDYIQKEKCQFGQIQYDNRVDRQEFIQYTLQFYKEGESRIKLLMSILNDFLSSILKALIDKKTQISWVKIVEDNLLYRQFCINYISQTQFEKIMDLQLEQYQQKQKINQLSITGVSNEWKSSMNTLFYSFQMLKNIMKDEIQAFYNLKQPQINKKIFLKMFKSIQYLRAIVANNKKITILQQDKLQIQKGTFRNVSFKDFLNIASLIAIRKFKQLNFLLLANKQLQKDVKNLHEQGPDVGPLNLLIDLSINIIGKQIEIKNDFEGENSIDTWEFQKTLIDKIEEIYKYGKKDELKQYFERKQRLAYFIIFYSKCNAVQKILKLCQYFKQFHPQFKKKSQVIAALVFTAQNLQEASLNGLAMNIYKNLHHTLSYKRAFTKSIAKIQKKQKIIKLQAAAIFFSRLLDEQNAFQCLQKALELESNLDERNKICKSIKQVRDRSKLEQRIKKYQNQVNSWDSEEIASLIEGTKQKVLTLKQKTKNNEQLFFMHHEDINTLQQIILRGRQRIYGLED